MYVQHNEQNNTADLYMTSKINIPEYDKESAIHQTLCILKQQSELVKVTIVNDFLKRRPKKHYEQFILSAGTFYSFCNHHTHRTLRHVTNNSSRKIHHAYWGKNLNEKSFKGISYWRRRFHWKPYSR